MTISVCMTTFNGERFLDSQIQSILNQLSQDDQLIISDDSSTDATIEIIKSYEDKRIILLENNTYKSPIFNLENALYNSSGRYIFLSDQDDIWLPEKVSICKHFLESYELIISDAIIINENGTTLNESFYEVNKTHSNKYFNILNNGYLGCAMAFRRDALSYLLPFPKKIAMHDIWIGQSISFRNRVLFINEKLIKYRRHKGNASSATAPSENNIVYRLYYRLYILYMILFRYLKSNKISNG